MSVKRGLRLQCRVRDDAPVTIKNAAAIIFSDFCKKTCPYISMINSSKGYIRSLDALMTTDTDVRVSVLENIHDKLGNFAVYQFQYKDNKYKTFALSNTGDAPINEKDFSESDGSALKDKLNKVVQKYSAIFPDEHDQMTALAEWYTKQSGNETTHLSSSDLAKYILVRVVPTYLATSTKLNDDDLTFIYTDLHSAMRSYLMTVGYDVGKHYITNQYVPDIQDSQIKNVHQNLFEHPKLNVIGVMHGLQIDDDYYYGGTWSFADLPNRESCDDNATQRNMLDRWVREKINNYVHYMKQEGMDNIHPVYLKYK